MKTTIKICFVFALTLTSSCFIESQSQVATEKSAVVTKTSITGEKTKQVINNRKGLKIKGSRKIASEERKVKGTFDKISSHTLLDVEIEQTDNYEIIVEADDNIIPYIVTEISSNKLNIYFDNDVSIMDFKQAKVYVKLPKISELKASSSSTIKTYKAIRSDKLKLDASSSGDIILTEVNTNSIDIDASSSGDVKIEKIITKNLDINGSSSGSVKVEYTEAPKIKLSASSSSDISIKGGKTTDLDIKASSSADVKTKNLSADNVNASATSNSTILVLPNISLYAKASSMGSVYYYNKPQTIEKETSSMGTIKGKTR